MARPEPYEDLSSLDDYVEEPEADAAAFERGPVTETAPTPAYFDRVRRVRLGQWVVENAKRWPQFSALFDVRDAEGAHVVVPVLATDPMPLVVELVRRAGGDANVVALVPGVRRDGSEGWSLRIAAVRDIQVIETKDGTVPVADTTTVADLFASMMPGTVVTLSHMIGVRVEAETLPVEAAVAAELLAA